MGYSILCRLLFLASAIFGASNTAVLELTTPNLADPDGLMLCLTTPSGQFEPSSFSITSLKEGGDQFTTSDQEMLLSGSLPANMPFFQPASSAWQHQPVEFGTLRDVLGTDPYFSTSYRRQRYDDFTQDGDGTPVGALVIDEPLDFQAGVKNCALLTGSFKRNTRYEITFQFVNPASSTTPVNIQFWIGPFTYSRHDNRHVLYSLRGSKYGTMCAPHSSVTTRLHSPTPSPLPSNSAIGGALLAATTATPFFGETSCQGGQALSPRFGGECVNCSQGTVAANGTCICNTAFQRYLIGTEACGPKWSQGGATSATELAAELCRMFTQKRRLLLSGSLSDAIVAREYVETLLNLAQPLLDRAALIDANLMFTANFLFDERRPDSPTRKTGLLPNCINCKDGHFTDFTTKTTVQLSDRRFSSIHALRLIGLVLSNSGYPCPSLFDPNDPFVSAYGPYKDGVCAN